MAFVLSAIGCGRGQGSLLGEGTSYLNGTGSSATFHLPDGSKVVLLPDTRIVVLSGTVELDGEALFEVAAGGFRIDTRDMKIEVLAGGSRLHVDAWKSRPGEEVDLMAGRLRAQKSYHSDSDSLPATLQAGEMVMINRDIDLMEKEKLSPAELGKLRSKFGMQRF